MNDHLASGSADAGAVGPTDEDGKPLEQPVLSMQAPASEHFGVTLPAGLPDLDLDPGQRLPQGTRAGHKGEAAAAPFAAGTRVPASAKIEGQTVMPKGWSLVGDIESKAPVTVGCLVKGRIEIISASRLEVQQGASVVGVLQGPLIVVRGSVEGEIDASGGALSIEQGATIRGKVQYTSIQMSGGEHQMELVHIPRNTPGAAGAH